MEVRDPFRSMISIQLNGVIPRHSSAGGDFSRQHPDIILEEACSFKANFRSPSVSKRSRRSELKRGSETSYRR
jgi:hypothetical protein